MVHCDFYFITQDVLQSLLLIFPILGRYTAVKCTEGITGLSTARFGCCEVIGAHTVALSFSACAVYMSNLGQQFLQSLLQIAHSFSKKSSFVIVVDGGGVLG